MNISYSTAPYGSWKSPFTAEMIVAGSIGLSQLWLDGEDLYWAESRPNESGRTTIVQRTAHGKNLDVLPAPFDARSRVHEYGGGAYIVDQGVLYFTNFADQRIYRLAPGTSPQPLTPELDLRFADLRVDRQRDLLYCVREDHTVLGEPVNTIVVIQLHSLQLDGGRVILSGNDFYSNPRLSSDGSRLAWLTWNHPQMPWDGTELWVGELSPDGILVKTDRIAGGVSESIFQPEWSPDGELYFVSDRTGWWNLYRWSGDGAEAVYPLEAEFGLPQWNFGMRTYVFESADRLICTYIQSGRSHLEIIHLRTLDREAVDPGYSEIRDVCAAPGKAIYLAGSPVESLSVIEMDLETRQRKVIRRAGETELDPSYFSIPEEIRFPCSSGQEAYGYYYSPHNPDFQASDGELPPLIVMSHGGPTSSTSTIYRLKIQYLTSRGLAVLDVNYSGSTGYGRFYRERLNSNWGVLDVDDCVNGAIYLADRQKVDPDRLAITGGSAGGYTTLSALTFRDVFQAGASYYGIGDLEALAQDTHKFESRYLDSMIGPYPEKKDLYFERSPIHFTERLNCALILLHGKEDRVVPPNQAETMYRTVFDKGLPVAYILFEGEGHGFRKAQNIKRSLEAELYFYARVFGFELAEPVEPVDIQNLPP